MELHEIGRIALVTLAKRDSLAGSVGYTVSNSGRTWFGGGGSLILSLLALPFLLGVSGRGEDVGVGAGSEVVDVDGV